MKGKTRFLITCEHASAEIPNRLKKTIRMNRHDFFSHKAFDLWAFPVALELRDHLKGKLHFFSITRLLIDANRKLDGGKALQVRAKILPAKDIVWLTRQYLKYRKSIFLSSRRLQKNSSLVALSVHTFTPKFNGKPRRTDIGLLFRPNVPKEKLLAHLVRIKLRKIFPDLKIHFNLPYRGYTDCLLNDLSNNYSHTDSYVALFLEINQRLLKTSAKRKTIAMGLAEALTDVSIQCRNSCAF